MRWRGVAAVAAAVALIILGGCGRTAQPYHETRFALDTVIDITAYGPDAPAAVQAAWQEMARLDGLLNCYDADSEVARINQAAGGQPVPVSDDTLQVIAAAVHFAALTDGAFDPTIGPVTQLWGIGKKGEYVPPDDAVAQAVRLVDYRRVELDAAHHTVRLSRPGMALDLGGIAKGYILDHMAAVLRGHGVTAALINGGGDIRVIGTKPDGTPWRIGIQDPRHADQISAKITLQQWTAVSTSGDYQRYFDLHGQRYHHIFDPRTGYPTHTIPSVTLLTGADVGDIPSSALVVMGRQKAEAFLRQFPGVAAVFIDYDGAVTHTPMAAGSIAPGR